jgi:site-specific recombinase XerD
MISLLAARPLRLKNFAAIEIDRHLIRVHDDYWLSFEHSETKNRRAIEVPFPAEIAPWVETYLARHRPSLLAGRMSTRLWISMRGTDMAPVSVACAIRVQTKRAFGRSINPHLFRDCLATSVAIDDPDHVQIAAALLGHATVATTQKYYDQSRMTRACRSFQSELMQLRGDLANHPYGRRRSR